MKLKWPKIKNKRKVAFCTLLIINCLAILLLWMCCASTWIHPETHPKLALLGLLFPIILIVNLSFILPWLIVRRKFAWIPLAGILPCISFILDYCPITFRTEVPKGCIKVMTFNINGFGSGDSNEGKQERKILTIEYLKNCDADIICLQEGSARDATIDAFLEEMDSMGYEYDKYRGSAILTRFHILDMDTIAYATHYEKGVAGNGSKWYELDCKGERILLVNNHLESNRLNQTLKDEYVESIDEAEYKKFEQSSRTMGGMIKHGTALRGPQVDSLCHFIERNKGKHIIMCGDFNDTPISYTYQRISKFLTNAYRQSGRGIGISYNKRGFWVRIDHIFVSDNCETYHTHIDSSIGTSDHYPLISWIKIN